MFLMETSISHTDVKKCDCPSVSHKKKFGFPFEQKSSDLITAVHITILTPLARLILFQKGVLVLTWST